MEVIILVFFFFDRKNSYLIGFINSDYVGDLNSENSISNYVFIFGSGAI